MNKIPLTVVIVTKDRLKFFKDSFESVLNQGYRNFNLLILDGGEKQSVENIVKKHTRENLFYEKINCSNIIEAWNLAVSKCTTEYISIFHDDDKMHKDFLEKSMNALLSNPDVGMSYTQANKIDSNGKILSIWTDSCVANGRITGYDYLSDTVRFGCCITIAPTVIIKKEVYNDIGPYKDEYCFNVFDFNYWIRVANKYNLHFLEEPLVDYRIHTGQMSQTYWWEKKAKGRLATMFELQNAISLLLKKSQTRANQKKVNWLIRQSTIFNKEAAKYAKDLVPGL